MFCAHKSNHQSTSRVYRRTLNKCLKVKRGDEVFLKVVVFEARDQHVFDETWCVLHLFWGCRDERMDRGGYNACTCVIACRHNYVTSGHGVSEEDEYFSLLIFFSTERYFLLNFLFLSSLLPRVNRCPSFGRVGVNSAQNIEKTGVTAAVLALLLL